MGNAELKQLKAQVAVLERRIADLLVRTGLDASAMDEYEREEAMDHLARTGDPSMIKTHLIKINGGQHVENVERQ